MAKRRSNAKKLNDDCTLVTFKRAKKGGRILPESQWMTVPRCKTAENGKPKHLKAHNRKQCRVGGKGPKAHLFRPCSGKR